MEGPITPGKGAALIALLKARDGTATSLVLQDGQRVIALNCAWGRDLGSDWEHVTLNVSPSVDGASIEFLSTADVVEALDPHTAKILYRRPTTFDETVRIKATAPIVIRRGALASVCGITAPADRHGEHWEQFPPGTIYLVEFEDGEALDVHESWLERADA